LSVAALPTVKLMLLSISMVGKNVLQARRPGRTFARTVRNGLGECCCVVSGPVACASVLGHVAIEVRECRRDNSGQDGVDSIPPDARISRRRARVLATTGACCAAGACCAGRAAPGCRSASAAVPTEPPVLLAPLVPPVATEPPVWWRRRRLEYRLCWQRRRCLGCRPCWQRRPRPGIRTASPAHARYNHPHC